jgi:hypothetical protein
MMSRTVAAVLGTLAATLPVAAGELTLSTERVVVFKDGYALFVKRATGTADERGAPPTGTPGRTASGSTRSRRG